MSNDRVGEPVQDDRMARTVAGLMLAPLVGSFLSVALFGVGYGFQSFVASGFYWSKLASGLELIALLANYLVAYTLMLGIPFSLVVGFGVHQVLLKLKVTNWWVYVSTGVGIALVGVWLLKDAFAWGYGFQDPGIVLLIAIAGATGALTFWLIRRPDRDAPSASPTP